MYCDSCGGQNREDAGFCSVCGADLVAQRESLNGSGSSSSEGALHEVGSVISNRYEIEAEIGRGGMGVVYRAHDQEMDMPVALKVLHPRIANRPDAITHLREEALAAMRLTHPNIVRLHHLENTPTAKYLLMEYVPGQSLATMLSNGLAAGFTERDVIRIGQQVCDGLAAAHKAGVIHRDIKPSNILLTPEGRVKIVDFGIARAQDRRSRAGGRSAGTPTYMAPEQFRGDPLDGRTDIYALGATIYEVLATHPPFVGKDMKRQHLEDHPEPIPGVSAWINEVVLKCLAKDVRDRWADVEELRGAFDGTIPASTPGMQAQRETDTEPEWRRVARDRERRDRMRADERRVVSGDSGEGGEDEVDTEPSEGGSVRVLRPQREGALPPAGPVTPWTSGASVQPSMPGDAANIMAGTVASAPIGRQGGRITSLTRIGDDEERSYFAQGIPSGVLQFSFGAAVVLAIVGALSTLLVARFGTTIPATLVTQLALGTALGLFWGTVEIQTRHFVMLIGTGLAAGLLNGLLLVVRGVTPESPAVTQFGAELGRALLLGGLLGGVLGGIRQALLPTLLAAALAAAGGLIAAFAQMGIRLQEWYPYDVVEAAAGAALFGFFVSFGGGVGASVSRTSNPLRL